jgi:hypothetical protein
MNKKKNKRSTTFDKIFRFLPDILVAIISALFFYLVGDALGLRENLLSSFFVGVLIGCLYDYHLKAISLRMINHFSSNISPIIQSEQKIPSLPDYAIKLQKVTMFDQNVIDQVLADHSKLLDKNRYLMSFEGYLVLLIALANKYKGMYCVNRALPIEWIAPTKGKQPIIEEYKNHLKKRMEEEDFKIYRLTIADKEEVDNQICNTYEKLRKWETVPTYSIKWFLEFCQAIFDNKNDDIQCKLVEKISSYFPSCSEKVRDKLFSDPIHTDFGDLFNKYGPDFTEAAYALENNLISPKPKPKKDHGKKIEKSKSFMKLLNKYLLTVFIREVGETGAYYMSEYTWLKNFEYKNRENNNDFGEIGVYINNRNIPNFALATVGKMIEDKVCLEIIDPKINIINCIDYANTVKKSLQAGNFKDLIT